MTEGGLKPEAKKKREERENKAWLPEALKGKGGPQRHILSATQSRRTCRLEDLRSGGRLTSLQEMWVGERDGRTPSLLLQRS